MTPIQTSLMIVFAAAALPLHAEASPYALAGQHACLGCHAVDFDHAGPSFQRIAERYGKAHDAKTTLRMSVLNGSGEKWGTAPMPPVAVPEKDLARILKWILEQ